MDLLKDLKMSLLNFNFFMIHIIHKKDYWLKITWITLKIVLLNAFLRSIFYFLRRLYNFFKKLIIFPIYDGTFKAWRRTHN